MIKLSNTKTGYINELSTELSTGTVDNSVSGFKTIS